MKDGPIRAALKLVARMAYGIDVAATRRLKRVAGEKPHRLTGACQLCAKCCESPMVQVHPIVWRSRLLRRMALVWNKHVNGFELIGERPADHIFVFRCTHFDPATRRCDSYSTRPFMCRDYPRALLWHPSPPFLKGCGYSSISPRAEDVARLLEQEEGLTEEQRDELKRKLRAYDPQREAARRKS